MNQPIPNSSPAWNGARSLLVAGLLLASGAVSAVPLGPDITATGSVEFTDSTPGPPDNDVGQSGSISVTVGGVTTSAPFSTIAGTTTPPAPNPLTGTLTETDDGIGWITDLDAGADLADFQHFLVDFSLGLQNNSLVDTFTVTIRIVFSHTVDSAGDDSFAESKLDLDVDTINIFLSEVLSDTSFGNAVDGILTGDFGGPVSANGVNVFDVTLAPGTTATISGDHQWRGGIFNDEANTILADIDLNVDISIDNVACSVGPCGQQPPPNVPEPATLALFGLGLSGLALRRRRRSAP